MVGNKSSFEICKEEKDINEEAGLIEMYETATSHC